MTHASRDTGTGLIFEEKIKVNKKGINLTKHNLYRYLKEKNIEYKDIISKKLLPDEAYYNEEEKILYIYEKNINKPQEVLMKNHRLVDSKSMNLEKLVLPLAREKFIIPTFSMTGLKNQNIEICLNT